MPWEVPQAQTDLVSARLKPCPSPAQAELSVFGAEKSLDSISRFGAAVEVAG